MNNFTISIDSRAVEAAEGESVLAAARKLGIDIPTLCFLEKCGPLNTCQVCLVKLNGKLVPSCGTKVAPGMAIESETQEVHEARRTALELLFSDHVGDCLSPCQRLCPLMLNIPVMLRHIEAERLDDAIATVRGALPLPAVLGRLCHHPCEQGCRRGHWDDPAAIRDMEKFVTDADFRKPAPHLPSRKPVTGKKVAIAGAGPTGLAAAYYLIRNGHAVTVLDRRTKPGGTLRDVPESGLPAASLEAEINLLARLGVEFRSGVELGNGVTLAELAGQFDAVLLAIGNAAKARSADLQSAVSPTCSRPGDVSAQGAVGGGTAAECNSAIQQTSSLRYEPEAVPLAELARKCDPNTCQTSVPRVFAAGSVVRPQKQLVRAMAEGRAAAECVHRFLSGQPARRPEKPFSSIMGRIDPGELRAFLRGASTGGAVTPCDACRGHTHKEAADESSRCLHCDCRSSGNCVLQHYAQVYGADANRFRSERRPFEQHLQSGGVIFEPGKCILCGICVKLTELAQEELGLTLIGRGFDVRVATPFNHAIEDGLQKVAEECVKQCPTGALVFAEKKVLPTCAC